MASKVSATTRADALLGKVTFVEVPHFLYAPHNFKRYVVRLRGRDLGTVERCEETTYRKVGRLRFGNRKLRSPRWCFRSTRLPGMGIGLTYPSRKQATWQLLVDLLERRRIRP